jgi:hypothetical protein
MNKESFIKHIIEDMRNDGIPDESLAVLTSILTKSLTMDKAAKKEEPKKEEPAAKRPPLEIVVQDFEGMQETFFCEDYKFEDGILILYIVDVRNYIKYFARDSFASFEVYASE